MELAVRGFAVVNFTYRLAPEFQFPAPLEDTNLVFHWIATHAAEYGFDLNNVFAVGDSAGAHLLGLYMGLCTDPDYAARFPFCPPADGLPKALGLFCGVYRLDSSDPNSMNSQLMTDFLPEGGSPAELEAIDVLRHINRKFPPVFFATCTGDFLQDQAALLANALTQHKVPFLYRFYGNADTELGHVFHLNIRSNDARGCNDDVCTFFRNLIS